MFKFQNFYQEKILSSAVSEIDLSTFSFNKALLSIKYKRPDHSNQEWHPTVFITRGETSYFVFGQDYNNYNMYTFDGVKLTSVVASIFGIKMWILE